MFSPTPCRRRGACLRNERIEVNGPRNNSPRVSHRSAIRKRKGARNGTENSVTFWGSVAEPTVCATANEIWKPEYKVPGFAGRLVRRLQLKRVLKLVSLVAASAPGDAPELDFLMIAPNSSYGADISGLSPLLEWFQKNTTFFW